MSDRHYVQVDEDLWSATLRVLREAGLTKTVNDSLRTHVEKDAKIQVSDKGTRYWRHIYDALQEVNRIDNDLLEAAFKAAQGNNTSLTAVVSDYLRAYVSIHTEDNEQDDEGSVSNGPSSGSEATDG